MNLPRVFLETEIEQVWSFGNFSMSFTASDDSNASTHVAQSPRARPNKAILDESGGWAKGARMYLPYEKTGNQFNDIHDYSGSQITQGIYDGYANIGASNDELKEKDLSGLKIPGKNVVPGRLSFVSELGYDLLTSSKQ